MSSKLAATAARLARSRAVRFIAVGTLACVNLRLIAAAASDIPVSTTESFVLTTVAALSFFAFLLRESALRTPPATVEACQAGALPVPKGDDAERDRLRTTTARWQRLERSLPDGFWDWDLASDEMYYSPRVAELLGVTPAELAPDWSPIRERIHADDAAYFEDNLRAHLEGGLPFRVEMRLARQDGTQTWFRLQGRAERAGDGKPFHMTGSLTDLTIERQPQEQVEIAALNVEWRNWALAQANEAAENACRQAMQSDRAKSMFLANMSHEIRTPMTAILGYTELLLDAETDAAGAEDRRDLLRTIQRNGEHLLTLINDILDLSKIEAGQMTTESIPIRPIEIVEDVARLLTGRAHAKEIELRVELLHPLPSRIQSDPTRLRQILVNLLGNAIKFTQRGEVILRMSWPGEAAGLLRFDVVDTGIGMTPEQLTRLFRPFTQADGTTTRKFGGTGLGLTISRRLAQMLGGDISVRTEAGTGSTFSLTVATGPVLEHDMVEAEPRMESAPRTASAPVSNSAPPSDEQRHGAALRGARILLAEDGADNRRLFGLHLTKAGARVEFAENGREAVDRALAAESADEPFQLVLMDMQMPEVDGYTATAELRGQGFARPIIALTANAMKEDRDRCVACGCSDFATKPIQRERLIELCRHHLEVSQAWEIARDETRAPESA